MQQPAAAPGRVQKVIKWSLAREAYVNVALPATLYLLLDLNCYAERAAS
jgi:hypothetical protein